MTDHKGEPGHGSSIAAWVTVGVIILAFSIGTLFFFLDNSVIVWLSAALALAGVVLGFYLRKAGYGVDGQHTKK